MHVNHGYLLSAFGIAVSAWSGSALAQDSTQDLMAMSVSQLRGEMQSRYDAALALTTDTGTVSANNDSYMWASQAKAQCGIAIGYLKSSHKDPVSVGKCVDAANRMRAVETVAAAPVAPPPAPPPAPQGVCNKGPYTVFFDWDKSDVTSEAATILDSAIASYAYCGDAQIQLDGYADRSGSQQYNLGISTRRNAAVRAYLTSHGLSDSMISGQAFGEENPRVPTADGVRELQNRRVEITIK